jgi:predicted kinase
MSSVIIITGFIATLKSTIAKKLGNDLNMLCLNKDDIKEILGDVIGFQNRKENLRLSAATFQVIKMMTDKVVNLGERLIIESNFKPKEINELRDMLLKKGCHVLTIYLYGDSKVLYDRYQKRQPLRHVVHRSTGLISFDDFVKYMDGYQANDYIGSLMQFDTTIFGEDEYQSLKQRVIQYLEISND